MEKLYITPQTKVRTLSFDANILTSSPESSSFSGNWDTGDELDF